MPSKTNKAYLTYRQGQLILLIRDIMNSEALVSEASKSTERLGIALPNLFDAQVHRDFYKPFQSLAKKITTNSLTLGTIIQHPPGNFRFFFNSEKPGVANVPNDDTTPTPDGS